MRHNWVKIEHERYMKSARNHRYYERHKRQINQKNNVIEGSKTLEKEEKEEESRFLL